MRAETATRLYVGSEVGTLRRVVLHRPDLELKRLTPRNKDALLFDDVLWVRRARQEHDAFADALADRGVEVLYLEELLAETLTQPVVRDEVIARTLAAVDLGPDLGPAVAEWLAAVSAVELADRLIGGITYDELPFASAALSAQVPALDGFVLAPLPNHLFTRDTSAWIYDGVSINAMAMRARRRESIHYDAIYRHHPLFAGATVWSDDLGGPAQLEGGDVLVIGNGCLLVGMGERTRPAGVERLASGLFEAGSARCVIAVEHAGPPLGHAPRHGDDDGRPRRVHDLPAGPRRADRLHAAAGRAGDGARTTSSRPSRAPSTCRRCACSRPAATPTRPSASSGTTATTCSPSPPASSRLRAQRRHQHPSAARRHRGHHDRRLRARPRPRRPALHVLPDREGGPITALEGLMLGALAVLAAAGTATAFATGLGAIPVFVLEHRARALRPFLWGLAAGLMTVASVVGLLLPALDEGSTAAVVTRAVAGVAFLVAARRVLAARDVALRRAARRRCAARRARLRRAARAQPARGVRDRDRVRVRARGPRPLRAVGDRAAEHPRGDGVGDPDAGGGLHARPAVLGRRRHQRAAAGRRGARLPARRADRRTAALLVRVRRGRHARARGARADPAGLDLRRPAARAGRHGRRVRGDALPQHSGRASGQGPSAGPRTRRRRGRRRGSARRSCRAATTAARSRRSPGPGSSPLR